MNLSPRLRLLVLSVSTFAVGLTAVVAWSYPPDLSPTAYAAFGTLLLLTIVSVLLAVQTSDQGSTTSMDFVPQLAAILLLGPVGAIGVTVLAWLFFQFVILRKEIYKAVFNVAQLAIAVAAAGVLFIWFGGQPSLTSLLFQKAFPPFIVAVLAYFVVNTGSVALAVALAEKKSFSEAWRAVSLGIIAFDLAMSPLAFLVAFLFIRWGPVALLLAVIPLIGLRYSYGVNIELQQLNSDLLRLMVKTIEAQDPYTSGHSIRVAERAKRIAAAMRLRQRQIRHIETAALLHDIGKIDIAYGDILRQKGPLTPEQRQLIRAHPDKGVDILRSVRSMHEDVLAAVKHHHERFDGDGYPAGIEGHDIPVGARIIMVCDTVDAMTTARPYRGALPYDVVIEELEKHKGAQFDPEIVRLVVSEGLLEDLPRVTPIDRRRHDLSAG